jgi:hypothetical protein
MRRGTPRRSEQNQSLDEEIGKIPEQLPGFLAKMRHVFQPKKSSFSV